MGYWKNKIKKKTNLQKQCSTTSQLTAEDELPMSRILWQQKWPARNASTMANGKDLFFQMTTTLKDYSTMSLKDAVFAANIGLSHLAIDLFGILRWTRPNTLHIQ
jgi:hypothetical protein